MKLCVVLRKLFLETKLYVNIEYFDITIAWLRDDNLVDILYYIHLELGEFQLQQLKYLQLKLIRAQLI